MQKALLLACCLLAGSTVHSQTLQWLQSSGLPEYTRTEAVKVSPTGSVYLCTSRDSLGKNVVSSIQKTSAAGMPVWEKSVRGQVMFTDLQVGTGGKLFLCGAYKGNIQLDAISLAGGANFWTGFVAMADTNGAFSWGTKLAVPGKDLTPRSLSAEANGGFYVGCVGTPVNSSGVFVYKFNVAGTLLSTKIINNDGGSVSHIVTDAGGNIYLTGTCSTLASFDGNPSQLPGADYQNMLLKYDSSFTFQWVRNLKHVTFDFINKIGLSGGKVFWNVVDYSNGGVGTRKLIRLSAAGVAEDSITADVPGGSGGRPVFSMGSNGRGLLAYHTGARFVFNVVDSTLQTIWKDSTNVVGNLDTYPIAADFNGDKMIVSGAHQADTLKIGGQFLRNLNTGGQFVNSDVFMAYWKVPVPASVKAWETAGVLAEVYPNPATDFVWVKNVSSLATVICLDAAGRRVLDFKGAGVLNVQVLPAGLYFLRVVQAGREQVLRFVKE